MADNEYSPYLPSYDYFGPLMDGQQVVPPNKLVEPETRMQPDMLQAAMGLQPEAGTYIDELGRVYSKETNKLIPEARRPNVIPLTRNPNNELEFAMPRALDIVGNVMGGVVAPVKTADGAMIMGAGPIRKAAEAAGIRDAYQRTLSPLGLYSHGAEAAMSLPQAKGSPQQFKAMLEKAGVRPVEFENAGFDDAFAGKTSVTKDDVAKLFADKMPALEEKVLGRNNNSKPISFEEYKQLLKDMDKRDLSSDELSKIESYEKWTNVPDTKFQQYTLPGSENYREVLLKAPVKMAGDVDGAANFSKEMKAKYGERWIGQLTPEEMTKYDNLIETSPKETDIYKSSHWDDPNVVAHVRMADRNVPTEGYTVINKRSGNKGEVFATQAEAEADIARYPESLRKDLTITKANGKPEKTLHIEELQSDWAQEGRKKGFIGEPTEYKVGYLDDDGYKSYERYQSKSEADKALADLKKSGKDSPYIEPVVIEGTGVPNGPYVGNTQQWTDLALKRALKEAADGNYDRMVWTPGVEQAKRYDLSKQIDELAYWKDGDEIGLSATGPNGNVLDQHYVSEKELSNVVGKELAEKILKNEGSNESVSGYPIEKGVRFISGDGLKIGGEGMKSYYDKIVPTRLKEIVKRIDPEAKIEMVPIKTISDEAKAIRGMSADEMRRLADDPIHGKQLYVPSIKMTPKLKEAIKKGLPAFSIGGAAALGVANSPNMRYNLKPVDHNPFEQKM